MSDAVMVRLDSVTMYGDRMTGWGVVDLPGWGDGGDSDTPLDRVPGGDGYVSFPEPTVAGLQFSIVAKFVTTSIEHALDAQSWAKSLQKKDDLTLSVWEGGRWYHLRGARAGKIYSRIDYPMGGQTLKVEIPVTTVDPRKYGDEADPIVLDALVEPSGGLAFPVVDGALAFGGEDVSSFPGVFQIHNPGTAEFFPTFTARGPMSGFTVTSESRVIEYAAPVPAGSELVVSPYLGGRAVLDGVDVSTNLLRAEWVPVAGGEHRGYLFTAESPGGGASLTVTYPMGAWW